MTATPFDDERTSPPDRPSAGPDPRRWAALTVLCGSVAMVILDSTSVLTALPTIERELGFAPGDVSWVFAAYAVAVGGLMLLGGRVADLLGRRRVFMTGIVLFVLASLLCGLSGSAGLLVAARGLQGIAAAVVTPAALSILMTTFAEGAERNRALGVWSAVGGSGATAGLLLGGPLTDGPGWPWIFFVNVPVGLGIVALSPAVLRDSRGRLETRRFDAWGALSVTAALVLLVFAITEAPEHGIAGGRTLALIAASAALVVVFVQVERRSPAPLVPLRILRSRTLVGGNVVILVAGIAVDGMLIMLTLYAQGVLGYSALQFGLMTTVMTASSIAGSVLGQRWVTRLGLRPVAVGGLALIVVACVALSRVSAGGTFVDDMLLGLVLFGPGMGAAYVAATIAGLSGVAEHDAGLASGMVETSFTIGSALGVAAASTVAVAFTGSAAGGQHGELVALTQGYQAAFVAMAIVAAAGLLATLLIRRSGRAEAAIVE